MRKHRRNLTVINNEIDYDKLAEAIVAANKKQQQVDSPSREWMKYILIPIFWGVSIVSGILGIVMFISLCKDANSVLDSVTFMDDITFLLKFITVLFSFGFCAFSIVAAKEIEKEYDRNYVAAMFSNIVAIAALVVALVALLKGVG